MGAACVNAPLLMAWCVLLSRGSEENSANPELRTFRMVRPALTSLHTSAHVVDASMGHLHACTMTPRHACSHAQPPPQHRSAVPPRGYSLSHAPDLHTHACTPHNQNTPACTRMTTPYVEQACSGTRAPHPAPTGSCCRRATGRGCSGGGSPAPPSGSWRRPC